MKAEGRYPEVPVTGRHTVSDSGSLLGDQWVLFAGSSEEDMMITLHNIVCGVLSKVKGHDGNVVTCRVSRLNAGRALGSMTGAGAGVGTDSLKKHADVLQCETVRSPPCRERLRPLQRCSGSGGDARSVGSP